MSDSSHRVYNFSPGPAVLPESVLRKAQQALWSLGDTGIGILEHSHRSSQFMDIAAAAEAHCRELARVPDSHSVLFLQGGASTQFFMVPMNLLGGGTADYIHTGEWSKKAMGEARRFGSVHMAASSEDDDFRHIPAVDSVRYSESPVYVHFTSNNTIFGTQFATEPPVPAGVPLICDASSDIFSRPIDAGSYGLIYAGAQKNLGPAGVTLVIIANDLIERGASDIPTMLQYRTHASSGSSFNTPPTFAIYILGEVLQWIRDTGGLAAMAERNRAKAAVIYEYLDNSKLFYGTVRGDSRSAMNICFRMTREELEPTFIARAEARGLCGLKGHRSVGGMRASIYNAFPHAGCEALVTFMKEFERENS